MPRRIATARRDGEAQVSRPRSHPSSRARRRARQRIAELQGTVANLEQEVTCRDNEAFAKIVALEAELGQLREAAMDEDNEAVELILMGEADMARMREETTRQRQATAAEMHALEQSNAQLEAASLAQDNEAFAQIWELEAENAALRHRLGRREMRADNAALARVAELEAEVEELQGQLEAQSDGEHGDRDALRLAMRIGDLERERESLRQRLHRSREESTSLQDELAAYDARYPKVELAALYDGLLAENERLQNKYAALKAVFRDLRTSHIILRDEIRDARSQCERIHAEATEDGVEQSSDGAGDSGFVDEDAEPPDHQHHTDGKTAIDGEIVGWSVETRTLREHLDRLGETILRMQQSRWEATSSAEAAKRSEDQFRERWMSSRRTVRNKKDELRKSRRAFRQAQDWDNAVVTSLERDRDCASNKINALEGQIARLQGERADDRGRADAAIARLQTEKATLQADLTRNSDEASEAIRGLRVRIATVAHVAGRVGELEGQIEGMRRTVERGNEALARESELVAEVETLWDILRKQGEELQSREGMHLENHGLRQDFALGAALANFASMEDGHRHYMMAVSRSDV